MGGLKSGYPGATWMIVDVGNAGINFNPNVGQFKIKSFSPHYAPTIKWTTASSPGINDWTEWKLWGTGSNPYTDNGAGPQFVESTHVRFKMYMELEPSSAGKDYLFRITVDHPLPDGSGTTNSQYNPRSGWQELIQQG